MVRMRLTVVGCAGSFPGPDSPASCYLLEADGFRLVIDFGNGSLGALQRYAALSGIDAVCLSHLHIDHCVDLYSYSVARAYHPDGQLPAIPVYGPAGTAERIGLISRIVPADQLLAEADRIARVIASNGPMAVRMTKELALNGMSASLPEHFRLMSEYYLRVDATSDQAEGLAAFAQKRKPSYHGSEQTT